VSEWERCDESPTLAQKKRKDGAASVDLGKGWSSPPFSLGIVFSQNKDSGLEKTDALEFDNVGIGRVIGFEECENRTLGSTSSLNGALAMEHTHLQALQILSILRAESSTRTPLSELLPLRYGGMIPMHTGAGIFGSTISKLVDASFIRMFDDQDTEITGQVSDIGDCTDWTLRRGYQVADFFRGRERRVFVSLTEKLGQIQSVLGVSVTGLLEDFDPTSMRIRPIFGKPEGAPLADVFVLMPFHPDFSPIYDDHIKRVCDRLKLSCKRADNIFGSSNIIDDVWELIANSKTIVADCTGRNPNVFYELGIAHTLGKRVVIITQSEDDIPFDIEHIRHIKYEYTPRGMKEFETSLKKFIVDERNKKL
jgi:hypothetical protein